jgi:hypothetical protein
MWQNKELDWFISCCKSCKLSVNLLTLHENTLHKNAIEKMTETIKIVDDLSVAANLANLVSIWTLDSD